MKSFNEEMEELTSAQIDTALDVAPIPFSQELQRTLKKALKGKSEKIQAKILVDSYYRLQEHRIRYLHQMKKLEKREEPYEMIQWLHDSMQQLEKSIAKTLDWYSKEIGRAHV